MGSTRLQDHFCRPKIPTAIDKVEFDNDRIIVHLTDQRIVSAPLSWFPVLNAASPEERLQFRLSPRGIHWDVLDEDIPIETFLDDYH